MNSEQFDRFHARVNVRSERQATAKNYIFFVILPVHWRNVQTFPCLLCKTLMRFQLFLILFEMIKCPTRATTIVWIIVQCHSWHLGWESTRKK